MVNKITVEIAFALPQQQYLQQIEVAVGSTISDVVELSGMLTLIQAECPDIINNISFGIWGKKQDKTVIVSSGDRIEIYRPLLVDPKENRRLRAKKK